MEDIKEVYIDGERIFLKKGIFGWGVVHPVSIDGKFNWKNFITGGSWLRFASIILIVIVVLVMIEEHARIFNIANECIANSRVINYGY